MTNKKNDDFKLFLKKVNTLKKGICDELSSLVIDSGSAEDLKCQVNGVVLRYHDAIDGLAEFFKEELSAFAAMRYRTFAGMQSYSCHYHFLLSLLLNACTNVLITYHRKWDLSFFGDAAHADKQMHRDGLLVSADRAMDKLKTLFADVLKCRNQELSDLPALWERSVAQVAITTGSRQSVFPIHHESTDDPSSSPFIVTKSS